MGCLSSSFKRARIMRERARKRSSVWTTHDIITGNLTADDWADVFAVSNLIRSQGIEFDVVTCTFERMFSKHPKIKAVFNDSGIAVQAEDSKLDPRLRAHIRQIVGALDRILELKSTDPDALEPYVSEIREQHRRIKGFYFSYFETFAHCYDSSFLTLVGPALTRQQKEAFRKFIFYLYKLLVKDDTLSAQSRASIYVKQRLMQVNKTQDAPQDMNNTDSETKQKKSKSRRKDAEKTASTADIQEAGNGAKPEISSASELEGDSDMSSK